MIDVGFEPYRRAKMSASLFRFSELLFGASAITLWLSAALPGYIKLVFGMGIVILFVTAILFCPAKPPKGDDKDG